MPTSAPDLNSPRVSVVVIGRNEGERLQRCLASILSMHYPVSLVETIYVDSNSSDGSVAMADGMGVKTIALGSGPATAARGRNAGWKAATSAFVFFLDGDTILDPDFVTRAMPYFADPSITSVWGIRKESDPNGSIYNGVFDLDWKMSDSFGGDVIIRRPALEAVGGYNEALIAGEDPDLCRRLRGQGHKNFPLNIPMTDHDLAIHHWKQYWRRSVRTGHAYAEVAGMYANTPDPLWLRESRRNVVRGLAWTLIPVLCLVAAIILHSPLPILLFLAAAILLIGRTAWNARRKANSYSRTIAYGLHSHLQQIPIFYGQLHYYRAKRLKQKSTLIEYKT